MVVSYTREHVYHHPWHRVTAAAWRKFTDPAARAATGALAHILDVHTLSRDVDRGAGRLRAVRAIAGRTPPPPLLLRGLLAPAGGGDVVVLCVERTDVDAPARDMRAGGLPQRHAPGARGRRGALQLRAPPGSGPTSGCCAARRPPSDARRSPPWPPGWPNSWNGAARRDSRRMRKRGGRSWRGYAKTSRQSKMRFTGQQGQWSSFLGGFLPKCAGGDSQLQ